MDFALVFNLIVNILEELIGRQVADTLRLMYFIEKVSKYFGLCFVTLMVILCN